MARRNRKIDLRLNDTEFERLNNDVQKTGLSREEYLRSLIKHSPINLLAQIEARCPSCKSDLQAEVTPEQKVTVQVIKEGNTSIGA